MTDALTFREWWEQNKADDPDRLKSREHLASDAWDAAMKEAERRILFVAECYLRASRDNTGIDNGKALKELIQADAVKTAAVAILRGPKS